MIAILSVLLTFACLTFAGGFAWVFPQAFLVDRHGSPRLVGVLPWLWWFWLSGLLALGCFGTAFLARDLWAMALAGELRG